jgi:hypothetical protein
MGQDPSVLTRRALAEADDVVDLVVGELLRVLDDVPLDEQPAYVRSRTPGLRMVWGVFLLDGEVNNGGFNQYFWNESHEYAQEAADGLRLIGADEQALILDEAMLRFREHAERLEPFYAQGTVEAFSETYEDDAFADLDGRYLELDTSPLQAAYIRAHPEEFAAE